MLPKPALSVPGNHIINRIPDKARYDEEYAQQRPGKTQSHGDSEGCRGSFISLSLFQKHYCIRASADEPLLPEGAQN